MGIGAPREGNGFGDRDPSSTSRRPPAFDVQFGPALLREPVTTHQQNRESWLESKQVNEVLPSYPVVICPIRCNRVE